jgi:hypothetical protein
LSEAIKNDIKEANKNSQTPTELSKHSVNVELWVQDSNRRCVVGYGMVWPNTMSDQ